MHIHLPKALHNWREIGGEIAIIVVGVLIALFFEQIVQRWEWQHKVAAAEDAMNHELLWDDGPQYYQRAAMHPCVVQRLDSIRAALEGGASPAAVWTAINGYWTMPLTYDTVAHEAAGSSDVSGHIPQAVLEPYALAYAVMPRADATSTAEAGDFARLQALRRTGEAFSEQEADGAVEAVEQLRKDDAQMYLAASWTLPLLRKLGPLDRGRVNRFMADARAHYGNCVRDLPANFPTGIDPG